MIFADLLVTGATWALVLGAAWSAVVLAAAVIEFASDGRLALTARLGCPAPVRRALLAGLGVALATGGAVAAGPVSAAPAPLDPARGRGIGVASGLPVPARPTGSAYAMPRQRVEVKPGDSLWLLAQDRSRSRISDPEIARLVERTYRANRRVIGSDPDLIRPGQRLRIPPQRRHTPPSGETMTAQITRGLPPAAAPMASVQGTLALDDGGDVCSVPSPDLRLVAGGRAELESFAHRFARAVVEVVGGDRGPSQLLRWTSEQVYAELQRRTALLNATTPGDRRVRRLRSNVRSVHLFCPSPEAAEISVHVRHGERSRAIAARIELVDGRWCCTALQFG